MKALSSIDRGLRDRRDHRDHREQGGNRHEERERVLAQVSAALAEIRYGAIEIVIQDSRVVQIERREKFRLDDPLSRSPR